MHASGRWAWMGPHCSTFGIDSSQAYADSFVVRNAFRGDSGSRVGPELSRSFLHYDQKQNAHA